MLKLIKNYPLTASSTASLIQLSNPNHLAGTQTAKKKPQRPKKKTETNNGSGHLTITSTAYNCHESPSPGGGFNCFWPGLSHFSRRRGTSINVPLTFAWTADKNCHNKQYNHDDNKNNVGNEEDT